MTVTIVTVTEVTVTEVTVTVVTVMTVTEVVQGQEGGITLSCVPRITKLLRPTDTDWPPAELATWGEQVRHCRPADHHYILTALQV